MEQHRCNSAENCRKLLETGSCRFLLFPVVSCTASGPPQKSASARAGGAFGGVRGAAAPPGEAAQETAGNCRNLQEQVSYSF
eukprot:15180523-Alexandrium_andersonii.AAC.1